MIGLLPTHAAFKPTPAVTAVDFNVGKQNRADAKVSGKRKKVCSHLKHCAATVFFSYHLFDGVSTWRHVNNQCRNGD